MPRILIVDDDARFRRALRLALVGHGYEITEVAGGTEALESLKHRGMDLVLLDWHMPVLSGLETCRSIHKNFDVPILVLSSDRTLSHSEVGKAGADAFLLKPFSIADLRTRIELLLRA